MSFLVYFLFAFALLKEVKSTTSFHYLPTPSLVENINISGGFFPVCMLIWFFFIEFSIQNLGVQGIALFQND
jgi:hypothetical protein